MSNSNMTKKSMVNLQPKYPNMSLYEEIILLMKYKHKAKWVIENVRPYYEPLIKPQRIGRHCFWSNFNISNIDLPAEKINQSRIKEMADLKGVSINFIIKSESKLKIIRNCVSANLGLHILNQAKLQANLSPNKTDSRSVGGASVESTLPQRTKSFQSDTKIQAQMEKE